MNALETFLAGKPFGFITDKDLPELIALHPLCQCLVRCGCCRFVCAAQDVAHLLKCIDAGGDYVRDVSVTSQEIAAAPAWRRELTRADVEAFTAKPAPALRRHRPNLRPPDEQPDPDYGGAFDGFRVTSDADPGL